MNIGLTLAAAVSSGQSAPGSNQSATGRAKTADGAATAEESSGERHATQGNSFSDALEKGGAERGAKHTLFQEAENGVPHWSAKGRSPWHRFDLTKPLRPEGQNHSDAEETDTARDTGVALAMTIHANILADERPRVPADMPRGQAAVPVARGAADGVPLGNDEKSPRHRGVAPSGDRPAQDSSTQAAAARANAKTGAGELETGATGRSPVSDQPRVARTNSSVAEAARDGSEARVTVLSSQATPAPVATVASSGLSPTGTALVAALRSDNALPQHAAEAANLVLQQQSAPARPVTMLKFQLHPAELGTVTVKLTGSGEQLAIEVQVENSEARHRLSTDSEAIVKALRGMGYDIDRITIQHAPSTAASPGGGANRESGFAAQDGRAGERQDQSRRQEAEQRHDQNAHGNPAAGGETRSGGVYI